MKKTFLLLIMITWAVGSWANYCKSDSIPHWTYMTSPDKGYKQPIRLAIMSSNLPIIISGNQRAAGSLILEAQRGQLFIRVAFIGEAEFDISQKVVQIQFDNVMAAFETLPGWGKDKHDLLINCATTFISLLNQSKEVTLNLYFAHYGTRLFRFAVNDINWDYLIPGN
jgi:hypothetical protein